MFLHLFIYFSKMLEPGGVKVKFPKRLLMMLSPIWVNVLSWEKTYFLNKTSRSRIQAALDPAHAHSCEQTWRCWKELCA